MKRKFLHLIIYSCLILILTVATFISFNLYQLCNRPMISALQKPIYFQVNTSTSASSLANLLKEQHFISSRRLFIVIIRLKDASHRLKAGLYEVKPGETAMMFLSRVIAGDVVINVFQIIEGTTQTSISKRLAMADKLLYNASDWMSIAPPFKTAEGLLLADSYYYPAGSTARELLDRAHKHLISYLDKAWQDRDPNLPYKTSYELLIVASIIEKEAAINKEKRLISGVIINRLHINMPLQMDPTVIYGMGENYKGHLSHNDLSIESPFNTYKHRGLPPTPIAMVGKEAIDAAAHPQASNYLYYVATGDGHHYFSTSYEEQKQAIARSRGKDNAK